MSDASRPALPIVVPREIVSEDLLRGTGYVVGLACRRGDYFVKGDGYNSRQRMRGHLGKHARDDRASARPVRRLLLSFVLMWALAASIRAGMLNIEIVWPW